MDKEQINNIYINCNRQGVDMEDLLRLCLDPNSGVTVDGLKAVNYKKIDQLEQLYNVEIEEVEWARSQNSLEELQVFVKKSKQGVFTSRHLGEAMDRLHKLAAEYEDREWLSLRQTDELEKVLDFIAKIKEGIYSEHYLPEALRKAELIEFTKAKKLHDAFALSSFIRKCLSGFYPGTLLEEAKALLEEWESGAIIAGWKAIMDMVDLDARAENINKFIHQYEMNPSVTAQQYLEKARKELERIADEKVAREDWIDAKQKHTILAYQSFINKHPYSMYREEAERLIRNMKGILLSDMKRYPFKYNREMMYEYISTNALTMQDLVDSTYTLTDRAYNHIKKFPSLNMEQRKLPVSRLENPTSEDGNTDVFFFGISSSGKTCVLSGIMSQTGKIGFQFDPKGPGGGGNYAMELRRCSRESTLPRATDQEYIQVIDCEINDEKNQLHKISLIEMSGEKTAKFAAIDRPTDFADLGPGAAGLLSNDNNKVFFFVIDPTNEKNIRLGDENDNENCLWVMQSDVLNCVSSLLSKNKDLLRKVVAIHIILTKSDTLGEDVDESAIADLLNSQGYQAVLKDLNTTCDKYGINKQTGYHVGLYPFCIGRFMPGDVYTFDETDSLKILRVIQKNTVPKRKQTIWEMLKNWFNS